MSFWEIVPHDAIERIAAGDSPILGAADPELEAAYASLKDVVLKRAESLNERDWEWLVVDYFLAQGARVDETKVGGSRAIIDAEAVFAHGDLGTEVWRIQVKRTKTDRSIGQLFARILSTLALTLGFAMSRYMGSLRRRARADEEGIHLMEAGEFTRFLLSGMYRDSIAEKLRLPRLR